MRTHNVSGHVFSSRAWFFLAQVLCLASLAQPLLPQEPERKVISRTAPDIPALARRLHLTGKVKLEVVIAPSGVVNSATLIGGSPIFEQNAVKALKQWKFERADKVTKEIIVIVFKAD